MSPEAHQIQVGATKELSLRVSVASLVRVVFQNPKDGSLTLALERKATVLEQNGAQRVLIKSQPFGGAVRVRSFLPLQSLVGSFHFDSERSRSERDFRIFIHPTDWDTVKEFCLLHLENDEDSDLESGPFRELAEEFLQAMGVDLAPEQFTSRPLRTVLEENPSPTENSDAWGYQTVRLYRIFEARLLDPILCQKIVENSERCSDQDLQRQALEDIQKGGIGWANAVLALPLEQVLEFYQALSPESRDAPAVFMNHLLDETVCTILEGISAPKYRSL